VYELRLSHWTGEPAHFDIGAGVAYRRFDRLFGRLVYDGSPVFGFHSTSTGVPLDTYGRNVYVDTLDSAYGGGWQRENSFLVHHGTGTFCYGFYPHGSHPVGAGTRYRLTVIGPGVTPDVSIETGPPAAMSSAEAAEAAVLEDAIAASDGLCRRH
jgi:hypothetical protein